VFPDEESEKGWGKVFSSKRSFGGSWDIGRGKRKPSGKGGGEDSAGWSADVRKDASSFTLGEGEKGQGGDGGGKKKKRDAGYYERRRALIKGGFNVLLL